MTSFEISILILITYICVYSTVHRVCKCIENCALSKMLSDKSADDLLEVLSRGRK